MDANKENRYACYIKRTDGENATEDDEKDNTDYGVDADDDDDFQKTDDVTDGDIVMGNTGKKSNNTI